MDLLPITERPLKSGAAPVATVDARLLHWKLQSGNDYATWIKKRIETYGFVEGIDFSCECRKTPGVTGRPKKEYWLTIDMATELCMIENTPAGREMRRWFIELRNRWLAGKLTAPTSVKPEMVLPDFTKPAEAARAWAIQYEQREALETQLIDAAPKAQSFDALMACEDAVQTDEVAKVLDMPPRKFRQALIDLGVVFPVNSGAGYVIKAKYVDLGWGTVREKTTMLPGGYRKSYHTCWWKPKGIAGIQRMLAKGSSPASSKTAMMSPQTGARIQ